MLYHLRRLGDNSGDSGFESFAIAWNEDGTFKEVIGDSPVVGCSMRVISNHVPKSDHEQDYWTTTPIAEILEENKSEFGHYVRFKTQNSYYEWWVGEYPKIDAQIKE